MLTLDIESSDADFIKATVEWVEVLAQGDYDAAWQRLWHPEGEHWTQDLMVSTLESYGAPDDPPVQRYVVTPFRDLKQENYVYRTADRQAFRPSNGAQVARIEVQLPLNGEMSDLTAILDVCALGQRLALRLNDIHVL